MSELKTSLYKKKKEFNPNYYKHYCNNTGCTKKRPKIKFYCSDLCKLQSRQLQTEKKRIISFKLKLQKKKLLQGVRELKKLHTGVKQALKKFKTLTPYYNKIKLLSSKDIFKLDNVRYYKHNKINLYLTI